MDDDGPPHEATPRFDAPKRRMLFIIDHLCVGGVQEFLLNYVIRMPDEEVTIASLFKGDFYEARLVDAGARLIHLSDRPYGYANVLNPRSFLAFRAFVRDRLDDFDVINIRLFASFLYASALGLYRDSRVSASIDATPAQIPFVILLLYRIYARKYKHFILHPMFTQTYKFLNLRAERRVFLLYFVTDRSSATPMVFPARYNFISIGRCIRQKGHQDAIRLFQALRPLLADTCSLTIIGDGPFREKLKHSVKTDSSVLFPGSVRNLGSYMTGCTAVFKLAHGEGENSVVREATLIGKPVVGVPEAENCRDLVDRGLVIPISRDLPTSDVVRIAAALQGFGPAEAAALKIQAEAAWGDAVVRSGWQATQDPGGEPSPTRAR